MNALMKQWVGVSLLATLLATPLMAGDNTAGLVDFGSLTPSKSGSEFVEVNINDNIISMAARLTEGTEPDVSVLLKGLKRIRVNVIGLAEDNRADVIARMKQIQSELEGKQWERIVSVQQDKEDVKVFIKIQGSEAVEGLAILILSDDKEAVLVNIVGSIRPEQLATIGARFDIEPLKKAGDAAAKKR